MFLALNAHCPIEKLLISPIYSLYWLVSCGHLYLGLLGTNILAFLINQFNIVNYAFFLGLFFSFFLGC